MHFEVLVEEPSAEAALNVLLPSILGQTASFRMHVYEGKQDLLSKLPGRLKGYRHWLPDDWRIIVLVDEDRKDCRQLKAQLEDAARESGLSTKSSPSSGGMFRVVNRLAIEELEAWFFGDVQALLRAYPGVPPTLCKRERYRNPDAIQGGTWECLERVLQRAGYYAAGMPKIEVAQNVAQHMDPQRNGSHSFQVFRNGLLACLS